MKNDILVKTIEGLRKRGKLWSRVAQDLEKPSRARRAVNLSRISRHTKENEVVVVPGKVLGAGSLAHPVTIGAYSFSTGARESIQRAKGKCLSLDELAQKYPDGKEVRLLG